MVLFTQIQEISQILPQLLATTTSISVKDPKSPQLLSLVYGDFVALSPRGGFMATIKREKFMAIQKGKVFVKDFVKDFAKDLSERQKGIVSRLFETGQKIVQTMP
jgi:hypothetical protein